MTFQRAAGGLCVIIVVAIVAAAFATLGPPSRSRALDQHRLFGLYEVAEDINGDYGETGKSLPKTYGDTEQVTDIRYEYRRIDAHRYELCATFEVPTPQSVGEATFWRHPAGRYCYRLDALRRYPDPRMTFF